MADVEPPSPSQKASNGINPDHPLASTGDTYNQTPETAPLASATTPIGRPRASTLDLGMQKAVDHVLQSDVKSLYIAGASDEADL